MEKIFKKSLALVLSAALCLTALVGCLTVSAEGTAAKPTYALNAVEGKPGDTVTVTADITNVSEVCAHLIDIVFPTDLTLGKVTDSLGNTYLSYEAWVAAGSNSETPYYNPVAKTDGNHVCLVEFINWPSGDDAISTTSMKFFFECTIPTGATAGTVYTLTPTVQAGKYDDDTKLMDVEVTPGKVTVTTATVCEHDWKFVSAVPATGSDNSANTETSKGSITLQCSKCDVKKTEPVNYNYYARTAMVGINLESETIMRFGARYERDFSRISTGANITQGYIVLDQVRGDVQVSSKVTSFADCDDAVDASNYKVYNATIGLIAVAMSDNVSSNVYAYDETTDAWYNGMTLTSSIASTGLAILQTSKVDLQKTMLVNLLNYGAAVQTEKDVNTANLANANIADYQNYAKAADEITDTISLPTTTDDAKIFWFNKFQLLLDSKITNAASFRLSSAYTGEDKDTAIDMTGYTVEIKYTNFKGTPIVIEVPSSEFLPEGRVNRHTVEMPFDAADLRAKVTYSVKLNGESAGPESVCSIEALVNGVLNQSSTSAARKVSLNAMMAYSDAAKAYLISK